MVISSIFCHYIAGYGSGRAKHDQYCHKFLVSVAEIDGEGKEKGRQKNQFDE